MSNWAERAARVGLLALFTGAVAAAETFTGIGRSATVAEVRAWDIDVRPDFKGLPPGSGSVARGQDIWESKCASCHGIFGESNAVFNPLVGGTTAEDIRTGRVASLKRTDFPGRTTFMKVPTVSTLWDYINRAMPWSQPKSLSVGEVYAVTAYLLNLADVVPADFTLSNQNIASVQQRMPNRNGMTTLHAMWPGDGIVGAERTPDVAVSACMKDCPTDPGVRSMLPAFARNANGNLAEQNRLIGPQRGVDTADAPERKRAQSLSTENPVLALVKGASCTSCHAADRRVVGPSWSEVAERHKGKPDYLIAKIRSGGSGVWGTVPMPPQTVDDTSIRRIADWLAAGAAP